MLPTEVRSSLWVPEHQRTLPQGRLFLMGGNDSTGIEDRALEYGIQADEFHVGLVPIGTSDPPDMIEGYTSSIRRIASSEGKIPQIDSLTRQDCREGKIPPGFGQASLLLFSGGDQYLYNQYLTMSIEGQSETYLQSIQTMYRQGATLAGGSAFISAVGDMFNYTKGEELYGFTDLNELELEEEVLREAQRNGRVLRDDGTTQELVVHGLGLFPGVLAENHADVPGRDQRIVRAIDAYGHTLVGLAVAEDTAVDVTRGGENCLILGNGFVNIVAQEQFVEEHAQGNVIHFERSPFNPDILVAHVIPGMKFNIRTFSVIN